MAYKPPDLKNRSPKVEILPDLRQRVTRVYDIIGSEVKIPTAGTIQPGVSAYALPWATADVTFPACLLVHQEISGQYDENGNNPDGPTKKQPVLVRIFETISPTGETQVGDPEVTSPEDGLYIITLHYLQFSVAVAGITPSYLGVGTSTISLSPFGTLVLKSEQRTDDGTLQRITRTYINAGQITQDIQTKYDGALIIETDTYINQVPPTPSGYTLIDAKIDNFVGLKNYVYTFAKGSGLISTMTEYRLSPDQGATGVTVTTIKYLSSPGASNPITPPGGTEEISLTKDNQDGYTLWTGIYASGTGAIATEIETKEGGQLIITTITAINAAPTTPSSQIGGTVVLIKSDVRNGTRFEDGTKIYTYTWAEGEGVISTDVSYENSINQGTSGITKTTIKFLSAPSITSNPITPPSGGVLVAVDWQMGDGFKIWTGIYASGTGTISSDVETKEFGDLILYRISAINTAPSTPASTIGGTVVLIDAENRVENGVTIYTYRWAEGKGLITDESTVSKSGALVIYHRVSLGIAPTAPSAQLGGTLVQFENNLRNADGYQIYDYRWAEGKGQASITTRGEPDGALIYTVVDLDNNGSVTISYPGGGSGYMIELMREAREGYFLNRAVFKKPPATVAFRKQVSFEMPGQIQPTSPNPGFVFVPPCRQEILATVTVSYGTSQVTTTPFSVLAWASLNFSYVIASNGLVGSGQKGLTGYLSAATSASGSGIYNGVNTSSWQETIAASTPNAPPSGSTTIGVENEPYLVDVLGNIVYKSIVTTYTF